MKRLSGLIGVLAVPSSAWAQSAPDTSHPAGYYVGYLLGVGVRDLRDLENLHRQQEEDVAPRSTYRARATTRVMSSSAGAPADQPWTSPRSE